MKNRQELYINHIAAINPKGVWKDDSMIISNESKEHFGSFGKIIYAHLSLSYPKYHKMDRISKLAYLSSELLMVNTGIMDVNRDNVATVFNNSTSTIETDTKFQESLKGIPSPSVFVYTLPNIMVGEICIRFGFKGENMFFVEPEFDAERLTEQIELLFTNSDTELCIAAWVDLESEENYTAWMAAISSKQSGMKLTKEAIYSHFITIEEEWKN